MVGILPRGGDFEYLCEGFEMPQCHGDRPPYRRVLPDGQLRPSPGDVEYPSANLYDLTGS